MACCAYHVCQRAYRVSVPAPRDRKARRAAGRLHGILTCGVSLRCWPLSRSVSGASIIRKIAKLVSLRPNKGGLQVVAQLRHVLHRITRINDFT